MFDSVKIKMKCPYCGEVSKIEGQTKELECELNIWNVGDFVTNKLNHLECLADCHSDKCMQRELERIGYRSGFGRMFVVKIFLKDGKVSGDYEIIS